MKATGVFNFDFSVMVNDENYVEIMQERESDYYSVYLDATQIDHLIKGLIEAKRVVNGASIIDGGK